MFRFLLISLLSSSLLPAQAIDPGAIQLQATISKVVDVQLTESQERIDWKTRKAEIAALLDLHTEELRLLNEELETSGNSAPAHLETTDELKSQLATLKPARAALAEAISRNIPRTLSLAERFPIPLLTTASEEIEKLRFRKTSEEPRETLRTLLSLLAKAHEFNRSYTRTTEVRDSRQVRVLYLGLACAFYTDGESSSGTGRPGPEGWIWTPNPEIKTELLTALDILEKSRPPGMVSLPLKID